MHGGPLGLVHPLLNLVMLPFGCVSSEDRELMKLKTVLEGSPRMQTPPCGHLTIHSSPQVTLAYLAANLIPLGLRITRQEIPQKLIRLGISPVVSLPGFFEHLLGLAELQLASLLIFLELKPLGPIDSSRFSRVPTNVSTIFPSFLHCTSSPFWWMRCRTATTWARYSLVLPMWEDGHVEDGPIGKLDLQIVQRLLCGH